MKVLAALFLFTMAAFGPMAVFGAAVSPLSLDAAVVLEGRCPGIVIGIW